MGGEARGRLDIHSGIPGLPGGRDSYYLLPFRLNSAFHVRPWWKVFAQAQDSRVANYDRAPCPKVVSNPLDLRQAYLEAGNADSGWRLRAGRQTLVLGDKRLVSTSNWGNVGPGFDGARLSYHRCLGVLRGLSGGASIARAPAAASTGCTPLSKTPERARSIEPYVLWKDYRSSQLQVYTYGLRSLGKVSGPATYNVEMAMQAGHSSRETVRAWAGHWGLSRGLWSHPRAPEVSAEYNYSSGDGNADDGRRGTFDQLFATNVFATATDFGWRNLHEPVATLEWQREPKWRLKTSYHHFWLADRRDGLYAVSGAVWAHNPSARESRVGGEIDFRVMYQMDKHIQFWCGYAHLFRGPYLKEAGRDGVDYPYATWTYSF